MSQDQETGEHIPAAHLTIAIDDVQRCIHSAALALGHRGSGPKQFAIEIAAFITYIRQLLINWPNDGAPASEADKRYRRGVYGNVTAAEQQRASRYTEDFGRIRPSSRLALAHAVNVGQITFEELAQRLGGLPPAAVKRARPGEYRVHDGLAPIPAGQKGGLKSRRADPPEQKSA
jgi:hypothetical protein